MATNTAVTATFNEAVVASSITTGDFVLKNSGGTAVAATVSYNSSTDTATLTPSALLANSTTYTATISGVTAGSGSTMASPVSWSFTTGPAPAVVSATPVSGATGVSTSSAMTATFNEAVQAGTISFALKNSAGSAVAATVAYNSATDTVTLTPTSSLTASTTYTATVSGALDTAGDPMSGPVTWSFTTITAAPAVVSETPASGAIGVATNTAVTATFNEAVVASSITTGDFVLKNSSGTAVTATVSYNSSTDTATLTPSARLANSTTYTATISGVTAGSGTPMASPVSWSFTTGPAPAVVSATPASGTFGVSTSSAVTATFNEAVQAGTINFTLKTSSGASLAATVSYNSSTDTATLKPSAALANSTTYTATVSGALDMAGDPMSAPVSWSFTTALAAPSIAVVPNGSVTYGTTCESSQTVKLPSGAAPGDLAVVLLTWNTSNSGRTSSPPTGWSTVAQNVNVSNWNTEGASVYYRVIKAGDSSWTFTMSGSVYMQLVLQTFSGVNTSSPIDDTATPLTAAATDTITANSVTVKHTGAWELIGVAQAQETNVTAPNFTGRSNSGYGATLLYDTTALNTGATGTVTLTGGGGAFN